MYLSFCFKRRRMIFEPHFISMVLASHIWFLVVYALCFVVPLYAGFIVYFELLLTKLSLFEKFTVFSNVFEQRQWNDYVGPLVHWYVSVLLYLFVRSVQSLLMFFLADFGMVSHVGKQGFSRTFLKKEIQRLKLEIIALSNIVKSFAEECKQFEKKNNKLTTDNRNLYREYETSIRTLEFLNTTIRMHLTNKSSHDLEQWSVVLECETRKVNQEEEDRRHALEAEVVS